MNNEITCKCPHCRCGNLVFKNGQVECTACHSVFPEKELVWDSEPPTVHKAIYCPVCGSDYIMGHIGKDLAYPMFSCCSCGARWAAGEDEVEAGVYLDERDEKELMPSGKNVEPSKEWFERRVHELEEENAIMKDLIKILVKEKKNNV